MSTMFTKADCNFLRAVGISAEPTFDDARLALAQRIAKQQAPVQAPVAPDAARLALVRLALARLLAASEEREQ
ncbi:MAG TPA: hypothetical protein VEW05_27670 [Candidatus Polarisedimenticolia bacterium]|nr:hypothetical protein [Candidatus Polarisedimenticolia bacterium]